MASVSCGTTRPGRLASSPSWIASPSLCSLLQGTQMSSQQGHHHLFFSPPPLSDFFFRRIMFRFQTGVIIVASFLKSGEPQLVHKLKGHEEEVHCLRWSGFLRAAAHDLAAEASFTTPDDNNADSDNKVLPTSTPRDKAEGKKGKRKGKREYSEISPSEGSSMGGEGSDAPGASHQGKAKVPRLKVTQHNIDRDGVEHTAETPQQQQPQIFLASSSRDRTLRIWAQRDGRLEWTLPVPKENGGGGGAGDQKARQWTSVEWSSPDKLELLFFTPRFPLPFFLLPFFFLSSLVVDAATPLFALS